MIIIHILYYVEKNFTKMKNKLYTTNFIINKKKLISNLDFFKKHNKKIIAMIKANAYGHGDIEIAKILEKENIYMLGVADFEEGIRLRKKNIKSRIIVTNPAENNIREILKYKMEKRIINKADTYIKDYKDAIKTIKQKEV